MNLKRLTTQISVFMNDGIMNPSKYKNIINEVFDNIFSEDILSINIDGVPDDMPLVRCSSKDNTYLYDFSRKRINFIVNFNSDSDKIKYDEFKNKVYELIINHLTSVTDISRIGVAIVYYFDEDDNDTVYWSNKYNFPLIEQSTSELSYTINNIFKNEDMVYNNVINISNTFVNTKKVPVISVDVNNNPVDKMPDEQILFILKKCTKYNENTIKELLK